MEEKDYKYYLEQGLLFLQKQEYDKAIENTQKAIDLAPNEPEIHKNLFDLQLTLKQYEKKSETTFSVYKLIYRDWELIEKIIKIFNLNIKVSTILANAYLMVFFNKNGYDKLKAIIFLLKKGGMANILALINIFFRYLCAFIIEIIYFV